MHEMKHNIWYVPFHEIGRVILLFSSFCARFEVSKQKKGTVFAIDKEYKEYFLVKAFFSTGDDYNLPHKRAYTYDSLVNGYRGGYDLE